MFLFAKVAAAFAVESTTSSDPCLPTSAAEPFTRRVVATTPESYTRSVAVIPVTVSSLAVIDAVVVGWVSVYSAAFAPLMVSPLIVIVLPVPTFLSANTPAAFVVDSVTVSPDSTPARTAEVVTSREVAAVVLSYTRFVAVMPVTVIVLTPILAVVLGWVSV